MTSALASPTPTRLPRTLPAAGPVLLRATAALLWAAVLLAGPGCSGVGGPEERAAGPAATPPGGAAAPAAAGLPEPEAAAPATQAAEAQIRALFARYLELHAAKDMAGWQELFLPGATAVETMPDGSIDAYPVTALAAYIAEKAKSLRSQHETLEDVRIEVAGNAASYSTRYTLFHDDRKVDEGRAFFLLARRDGQWKITALTWYSQ
jgi:ketosteroid isomerase-like protein